MLDALVELFKSGGVSRHVRCDNGPGFIAKTLRDHLASTSVETLYIEPRSPWQNGYVESFDSRFRDELLKRVEFEDMKEACWHIERRRVAYNEERPHSSLGYQTPSEFASQCAASTSVAAFQRHTAKDSLLPITQTIPS